MRVNRRVVKAGSRPFLPEVHSKRTLGVLAGIPVYRPLTLRAQLGASVCFPGKLVRKPTSKTWQNPAGALWKAYLHHLGFLNDVLAFLVLLPLLESLLLQIFGTPCQQIMSLGKWERGGHVRYPTPNCEVTQPAAAR